MRLLVHTHVSDWFWAFAEHCITFIGDFEAEQSVHLCLFTCLVPSSNMCQWSKASCTTAAWLLCRGRKAQQRWTDDEVELLIRAREVLGNNTQWAVEALSRWDFGGRENIHLHDKWKNMVRSVKEQKTTRGVRLTQEQCDRIQQVREFL